MQVASKYISQGGHLYIERQIEKQTNCFALPLSGRTQIGTKDTRLSTATVDADDQQIA